MAKASPRAGKPDCWVTAITALLAGDAHCEYAPWYLGRHWVKGDGSFDRAAWIADHAVLLKRREQELRAQDFDVTVENQNAFTLFGSAAKLSGKPDLIATKATGPIKDVLVSDAKTGARRISDRQQVLIYMWSLPRVRPDLQGAVIRGEIVYTDGIVEVEPHELTPEVGRRIVEMLRLIGFTMPPERTPSERECQFCKLSTDDCPDKARMVGTRIEAETSEF